MFPVRARSGSGLTSCAPSGGPPVRRSQSLAGAAYARSRKSSSRSTPTQPRARGVDVGPGLSEGLVYRPGGTDQAGAAGRRPGDVTNSTPQDPVAVEPVNAVTMSSGTSTLISARSATLCAIASIAMVFTTWSRPGRPGAATPHQSLQPRSATGPGNAFDAGTVKVSASVRNESSGLRCALSMERRMVMPDSPEMVHANGR